LTINTYERIIGHRGGTFLSRGSELTRIEARVNQAFGRLGASKARCRLALDADFYRFHFSQEAQKGRTL
jgi:hypothetical protein